MLLLVFFTLVSLHLSYQPIPKAFAIRFAINRPLNLFVYIILGILFFVTVFASSNHPTHPPEGIAVNLFLVKALFTLPVFDEGPFYTRKNAKIGYISGKWHEKSGKSRKNDLVILSIPSNSSPEKTPPPEIPIIKCHFLTKFE